MTYTYKCRRCIMTFETHRSISDHEPTAPCPSCGAECELHFNAQNLGDVHFVGREGWTSTGGSF